MTSPWPAANEWVTPVFLLSFGAAFLVLAWKVLAHYREAFVADARAVMSLEVLAQILELGGPGYLIMTAFIVGGCFFLVGAFILILFIVEPLFDIIRQVLHAIGLGFR